VSDPQPIATGDLKDTPFGGLLNSIYVRKLTGSLVIAETPERRHCVGFQSGMPNKTKLVDPVDLVGEILIEAGYITPEHLAESLDYAQQLGLLLCESAMVLGHISPEAILQALVVQTARRTARLFALFEGAYGFYHEDFLASFGGDDNPTVDPFAVISAGVRSSYDQLRLTYLVQGLQGRPLRVEVTPEQLARFRFEPGETEVARALADGAMIHEALASAGQPPQVVYGVAHCLHMTGLLRLESAAGEAPAPPQPQRPSPQPQRPPQQQPQRTAPPQPPARPAAPSPPASPSPPQQPARPGAREPAAPPPSSIPDSEKSDRRREAEALLAKGDKATYFELLGITREAAPSDVQKAFALQARKFHPDKCTGDMAELRTQVTALFSRMTVAKDTLKDPAERKRYLDSLDLELGGKLQGGARAKAGPARPGESAEDQFVRQALEADEAFMKAKILLKRNQLEEAEKCARAACEADPEQGNYQALLAWIEAKQRPSDVGVEDLIQRLNEALKQVPKSEDAHFYLAQLYYQTNKLRKALDEYEEVVELNRDNIDALRMVRILKKKRDEERAKRAAQKTTGGGGGFFSSLFSDTSKKK
jgi:tetratricopeptide (TPR) repeat protein